jgi:predicted amidohydrolase
MEMQLRVALAQYPSGREPAEVVAEAKAAAADIVVFPEMYSNGYARFDPDDLAARARWCTDVHDLAGDHACGDVRIAQMRGRAFETVMGIAVANYPSPRCDGHSFAVDPSGAIIVMADHSPGLTIAEFDLAAIRRARLEDRFRWQI